MLTDPPATTNDPGLADRLKAATDTFHRQAERTGIVNEVLRGTASIADYRLWLRNLLPAYQALEGAAARLDHPAIAPIMCKELRRTESIERDLIALAGDDWRRSIPELPQATRYAGRIEAAAAADPVRLIGHAYVRYLGDLNGGMVLKRRLGALGIAPSSLGFFDFDIADLAQFRADYRDRFDRAGRMIADITPILDEARAAFTLNIEISDEVLIVSKVLDTGQK